MLRDAFATGISIQAETAFNAASAATIYNVAGKVGFSFTPILEGGGEKVDVWRNATQSSFELKHYRGALNAELGVNLVTKHLLEVFFELLSTTALGGGITEYRYRPRRIATFGSVKIGIDYEGGPFYALHGLVIDSISVELKARQLARLSVGYKAARIETLGGAFGSGATAVEQSTIDSQNSDISLDGAPLTQATDFAIKFAQEKAPAAFGADKLPTRFADAKPLIITGDIGQYSDPSSSIRDLTDRLGEAFVIADLKDRENATRKIRLQWPRASFQPHARDTISANDTMDRVQFIGLQDSDLDTSSEPVVILCL